MAITIETQRTKPKRKLGRGWTRGATGKNQPIIGHEERMIPPREAVDFQFYCEQNLKTEKGETLDFESRPYLKEIYDCLSPQIVLKKASQIGMSGYAINRCLWLGEHRKMTIIYVLPTRDDVSDFSQARFNSIAGYSKIRSRMEIDNVGIKQIGNSFIYFRGTWIEKEATMIAADMIVLDEFDKCKQDTAAAYQERLSASRLRWKMYLSTPSYPNYGIDEKWQESDRREWFVKCGSCSLEQILTDTHIDYEQDRYRCEKCGAELDNRQGEWKATAQSKIAGFHPTQFTAPWIRPRAIIDKRTSYKIKRDYFNFVKGDPYAGGTDIVNRVDILSCLKDTVSMDGRTTLGIDWGDESWFVVRKPGRIIHWGKVVGDTRTHPAQFLALADKFEDCQIVADFGYGDTKNKTLIESRPEGTVWMCVYTHDGKDIYPHWVEKDNIVRIDRTRSLEEGIADLKEKRTEIVRGDDLETMCEHYSNIYEKQETDNSGRIRTTFERKGADHLVHANNYASMPERTKDDSDPGMTVATMDDDNDED